MSKTLALRARVYLALVAAASVAAAVPLLARLGGHTDGWLTFGILGACAAIAQLFVVFTTKNQSYHTAIAFMVAAALLLPPELVALMGVVQHLPEWLKQRYAWYIQTFNICNYTLNSLAAWGVARLLTRADLPIPADASWALAGLVACVVFVVLNHLLLGWMLYLGRGHRLRETGLFTWISLSTELVLAALGIGLASLWLENPWLVPFSIAPILLVHRSLHVPRLEEEARIDPKTGLYNARHFSATLEEELARAGRFGRPLSVIMADLDLLREINNSYGHLAGDAILSGIADVFRTELRDWDVAARFGGEEFAILLPETRSKEAMEIAERIRKTFAAKRFEVDTSSEPLRATISLGVAAYPKDGTDAGELLHNADLAAYRAKLQGRNRALEASAEPFLVSGGQGTAELGPSELGELPGRPPQQPDDSERIQSGNASAATAAIESLSALVDTRDALSAGHSRRVQRLALAIGRELGLSGAELDLLGQAALLHDIGKPAIPDALLLKPSRLDAEEWGLMQRHPDEGARTIDHLGFLEDAAPWIRHHQERFDGTGYPDHLKGEEIPLGARIIHVADALDSMLTTQSYGDALTLPEALEELRDLSGRQFCPRCVSALDRVLPSHAEGESPREQLIA